MKPTRHQPSIEKLNTIQENLNSLLLSEEELPASIFQLEKYKDDEREQEALLEPLFEANAFLRQHSVSILDIPVSDILRLLHDIYKGKINDHLQDILNNAEIEVSVLDKEPNDTNNRKELDINIKVSATAIERYAGLIKMALGEKSLDKNGQKIVKKAYDQLDHSSQRLTRIIDNKNNRLLRLNLLIRIKNLAEQIDFELHESKAKHCFSLFPLGHSRKDLKAFKALSSVLNSLNTMALTADELAGGLYLIKIESSCVSSKSKRDKITTAIDMILSPNQYPKDYDAHSFQFIASFTDRAEKLCISWPAPFSTHYTVSPGVSEKVLGI